MLRTKTLLYTTRRMLNKKFSPGISLIAWATGIRWIGWGFVEPILPLFLFSFGDSFANAGLLKATYDISYLLFLPITGILVDKISAKKIILIGLIAYPLIGLSYSLAAFFSITALIVVARFLNGFAYAFDSIGRATYYMRAVKDKHISSAFGHFDSISSFVYIGAMLLGLLIVPHVSFQWLALLIIPFSLIAVFMIQLWLPSQTTKQSVQTHHHKLSLHFFRGLKKELTDWGIGLHVVGIFVFFLGFIKSVVQFVLPIFAFTQGASITQVIFMAILLNIPTLFGDPIGRVADNHRLGSIIFGLCMTTVFFFALAFDQNYIFLLITILGIGFVNEIVGLSGKGIMSRLSRPSHYGKTNSIMEALRDFGTLSGPIVIGLLIDLLNPSLAFITVGSLGLLLAGLILLTKQHFDKVSIHHYHQRRHVSRAS